MSEIPIGQSGIMGAAYSSAPGTTTPIVAVTSDEAIVGGAPSGQAAAAAVTSPMVDPLLLAKQLDPSPSPQPQQADSDQKGSGSATAPSPSPAPPVTSGDMAAAAASPPSSSKAPRMVFDPLCFFALYACLLLPWVGLPLYRRFIQVEVDRRAQQGRRVKKFDALVPNVLADSDDESMAEDYERQREQRLERISVGRQQSLMAGETALGDSSAEAKERRMAQGSDGGGGARGRSHSGGSRSHAATGPFFAWTWPSLLDAIHHAFPLIDSLQRWWRAEGQGWEETCQTLLEAIRTDKRYFMHPRFYPVASRLSLGVTALLAYLLLVDGVAFQLHNPLLYALRFHLCALGAFAAVSSVHSRGLVAGYKAVLRAREEELERTRMKFILDRDEREYQTACAEATDASSSHAHSASPSPSPSPSPPAPAPRPSSPRLQSTNALLLARAIDSLSKQHKGAQLERRLVYILCMCLLRGLVGGWGALTSGSSLLSAGLHCAFHWLSGFAFFALAVQTEFELHDDLRRWAVFSAMHSATMSSALRLPFHLPLRSYPGSDNILGWYQVRSYLKDLKGRFDFARMQVLLVAVGAQLVTVAIAPLYISYASAERPVAIGALLEQLIAGSPLAAVDTALCLWLLLDMVAVGVAVNAACGRHAAMLQEQELQASFALSSAPRRDRDTGGERALKDSIVQLKALKERLTLVKESEKLAVWGFKLDERITTYLRTALVSYALLFMQTLFFKRKMGKEVPKTA